MAPTYKIEDANQFEWIWKNGGRLPGSTNPKERLSIQDALSVPNAPLLFPKVIQNIVKEAAEPLLVGTSLLSRINYTYGQTITFPAIGALDAADIPEGGEYPERSVESGGGTVTASIGKVGLAVKFTEEMLRYSQYDVMALHLRAAGRALARHKEKKIFNYVRSMGATVFDNLTPTSSINGVTHGRNLQGQPNGSMIVDDVFDMYAQLIAQGFMGNTLLMHPLAWVMWVKDPVLRAFALQNGGGVFFATWTGNPAGRAPWESSGQGKLGVPTGQNIIPGTTPEGSASPSGLSPSSLLSYPQDITSAPQMPSYAWGPMLIIVSPFVFYDERHRLTDIYMFDRSELGALIVDEEITTEEFTDPARDMRKVKLRERYAVGIFNDGQGIACARNVRVVPNEIVLPPQATIEVSSTITSIPPNVPITL